MSGSLTSGDDCAKNSLSEVLIAGEIRRKAVMLIEVTRSLKSSR